MAGLDGENKAPGVPALPPFLASMLGTFFDLASMLGTFLISGYKVFNSRQRAARTQFLARRACSPRPLPVNRTIYRSSGMVRVRVRLNGAATGVHLVIDPETMSRAEFIAAATDKLGQKAQNTSAVKLYIDGDEAQVNELEKGDLIYVALTGSPSKESKLARTDVPDGHAPDVNLLELLDLLPEAGMLLPEASMLQRHTVVDSQPPITPTRSMPLLFQTPPVPQLVPQPVSSDLVAMVVEGTVATCGVFFQRVLSLGLKASANPDAPRVSDTMDIEVAESFSWSSAEDVPVHSVLSGDYRAASIQRMSQDSWHVRCFSNSFVDQIIAASNAASGQSVVQALFDMGWFRQPQPKPKELMSSRDTAIVCKPKATRRAQHLIEAEWKERVGHVQISDRVVLFCAGPEYDPVRYAEPSIQDVFCVPCDQIGAPSTSRPHHTSPHPTPQ